MKSSNFITRNDASKIITANDLEQCPREWCNFKGEGIGMKIHLSRYHSPGKDKKRLEERLSKIDDKIKKNEEKISALHQEREKTMQWLKNT